MQRLDRCAGPWPRAASNLKNSAGEHARFPHSHGRRHPGPLHGRRTQGQVRSPGHADGHGRRRHRAVDQVPQIRRQPPRLGRPRPLRAVGRPRLDAAVFPAAPVRLQGRVDGRDQELPPVGFGHPRPPRIRPHPGRGDHHRAPGPGPRHRRRHGHGRAPHGRPLRRRPGRPPHLGHRRRRLPDGGRQPRGHLPGRALQAQQADRPVRRQQHHHRRRGHHRRDRRPGRALQGRRLGDQDRRRPRPRRHPPGHALGDQALQAGADRLQDQDLQGRRGPRKAIPTATATPCSTTRIADARKAMGWTAEPFTVPDEVLKPCAPPAARAPRPARPGKPSSTSRRWPPSSSAPWPATCQPAPSSAWTPTSPP